MTSETPVHTAAREIDFHWAVPIPLRDGIVLRAVIYLPKKQRGSAPCIVTLTPYGVDHCHDQGLYFGANGYPFAIVDVRGRGNSQGEFRPKIQEAKDGYDVVEWIARQPFCNGRVAMWGGSYGGYAQWATAKEFPPHLTTIVPVAAPYMGIDVPMRNNIFPTEAMQYLTLIGGRTTQWNIYSDRAFWAEQSLRLRASGRPFRDFDTLLGHPSATYQEYLSHPHMDAFWDAYNPTPEEFARLELPVLTITGIYDDDQPGALAHYRAHMENVSADARSRHYLVIGPWDHAGTRAPKSEVGGLTFGAASLIDMKKLHLDWYAWTMQGGPRPRFLNERVAYYVTGADVWQYADSLEAVTQQYEPYFLGAGSDCDDGFSGELVAHRPAGGTKPATYVYDPADVKDAQWESTVDPAQWVVPPLIDNPAGRRLVYRSSPFDKDRELCGFFTLTAWLSINQADTDFSVSIYDQRVDGSRVLLTTDRMRARYRQSVREPRLVETTEPLRYEFSRFTFAAHRMQMGHRLQLVIGPINSIYIERNFNGGGVVADESIKDSKPVTVVLHQDDRYPSALYVPIGKGG
jgi:uncharacterized protein